MTKPRVTLSVITHNCEDYVVRFLNSFEPVFDELCLVRAIGSAVQDETLKMAARWCADHGKEIRTAEYRNAPGNDWPHVDDFAAARQLSFDIGTAPWIMWADMDDRFEGDPAIVRQLLDRGGYAAFVIPYRIFARGVTVNRARIMARGSGQWKFPVHEDYRFHIEPCPAVQEDRVAIVHEPFFATKTGSNERNLRILRSIPEPEMTCGLWFHLHGELAAIGDTQGCIDAAKKALESPAIGKPEKYEIFLNFAQLARDPNQKEAFLVQAYQADPTRREALGLLANNALNYRRNREGLAYARQMMATAPALNPEWNDRQALYGWVGADLFAQALRANGHFDQAEDVRFASLKRAGGPRIALLHATRGRPEQASLARKLWLDLAERPDQVEHIFVFDQDDTESEWLNRFHYLTIPAGGGCVAAWNHAAFATQAPVLVQLSDDWMPPARWDQLIIERIGDPAQPRVLAVSDGLRTDDLLCMAICTRAYFNLDYFLFHPRFSGVCSDNWFTEQASSRGLVIEARDLVFQHNHPFRWPPQTQDTRPKIPFDETYQRQNSPQAYHEGKATLEYLRIGNDWSSIPGWFNYWGFYRQIASTLKEGDTFAEIGVWFGRSIIYLAQELQRTGKHGVKLIAVDTFKGEKDQPAHVDAVRKAGGSIRPAFEANLTRCGVRDMVTVIEGDSAESAAQVHDGSLAGCFIDAAHDLVSVRRDLAAWTPKIKPGGIISGHDAHWHEVVQAAQEKFGSENLAFVGNVWLRK